MARKIEIIQRADGNYMVRRKGWIWDSYATPHGAYWFSGADAENCCVIDGLEQAKRLYARAQRTTNARVVDLSAAD